MTFAHPSPLAGLPRPFSVRPRARDLVVVSAPVRAKRGGLKPVVMVKIPRTDDLAADHALAALVASVFDMADAARQLLELGHVDRDGVFTYAPPPREGADAIRRLEQILRSVPPPPPSRCSICRVKA